MPVSTVSETNSPLDEVVYNTLSDVFSFTNEDEKRWWHSTGPMFAKMLRMANYDIHSQYKHLAIYKKRVIPFLGVYPERDSNDRWLSILTRFGTPFELSLNCSDSVVRYTYEPINSSTGTADDLFNTHSIWKSLNELVAIQPDVNLEWFNHFKQELTLSSAESKFLAEKGPLKTGIKTQNKLALDLKGDRFVLKTYIYPELKAIASGKSTDELIFDSVRKVSLQHNSILPALSVLEEYAKSRSGLNSTTSVRLLSCDLVKPAISRIKIYILERMVSLPAMKDLWTLGGRFTDPATVAGFKLIEELWDLLCIPEGLQTYPASYLPIGSTPNEQLPTMANYTLHHDEPMPEPQLYFNTFGMNDMAVADALTTFFERHGWTEMAQRYKESLQSYYPHANHSALNYLHAYISFSYRKNKPYLSVYLHSLESGDFPVSPFGTDRQNTKSAPTTSVTEINFCEEKIDFFGVENVPSEANSVTVR